VLDLPPWFSQLLVTVDGQPLPSAKARNTEIALTGDPAFARAIGYDVFRGETMVTAPLPWAPQWQEPRPWEYADDTRTMLWLQERGLGASSAVVSDVVDVIAGANAYHPLLNYFSYLGWTLSQPMQSIWDGRPRVGGGGAPSWLTTYCGVADSPYVRAVGAGWPILGVARVFDPGCRASVLVLAGAGGAAKTAVFRILGGPFYGTIPARSTTDCLEQLRASWVIELADLDVLRRPDWRSLFGFVSRSFDRFRHRRRRGRDRQRPGIFGAATERESCQAELWASCEWHFVCCDAIDLTALARDRDQFWAEALVRYWAREHGAANLGHKGLRDVAELRNAVSIVKAYLAERCEFGPTHLVEKDALFQDHCSWREVSGVQPIDKVWFGRHLRAAYPKVGQYRPDKRSHESYRRQLYRGLRLLAPSVE
jgi:hypothetical protein